MQLHLHEGNDDDDARRYWIGQTGLTNANFYRTFIKPKGTGHRTNRHQHGVCTIKMRRGANGWNIVMSWIEALTGEFGLDDPKT